jgi:hypothetical protein
MPEQLTHSQRVAQLTSELRRFSAVELQQEQYGMKPVKPACKPHFMPKPHGKQVMDKLKAEYARILTVGRAG